MKLSELFEIMSMCVRIRSKPNPYQIWGELFAQLSHDYEWLGCCYVWRWSFDEWYWLNPYYVIPISSTPSIKAHYLYYTTPGMGRRDKPMVISEDQIMSVHNPIKITREVQSNVSS